MINTKEGGKTEGGKQSFPNLVVILNACEIDSVVITIACKVKTVAKLL